MAGENATPEDFVGPRLQCGIKSPEVVPLNSAAPVIPEQNTWRVFLSPGVIYY